MSGRGRQARTNVLASNGDRQAKNRGSLITSTRSSSGSPSQRTRSLTPKVQETGVGGGVGGGVKPKKRVSNSSVTQSNPASSLSNRRNSTERRKIRRPKFQDNPPAPEIVEKNALQLVVAAEQASQEVTEEDDEEEEEEVDDDEEAAIRQGCESAAKLVANSNGIHEKPVSDTVSSLVGDIVDKIEDKELNGRTTTAKENEDSDDDDDVRNELSLTVKLQRELKQAVKELIAQQHQQQKHRKDSVRGVAAENKPENNSFESQLKACLSNQIKVSLANIHEIVGLDRKVDNPTQLLVNVLNLAGNSNNPTLNLDQRKRNSMVYELVSFLEMELKAVITELKLSEETEESTDDNAENPTMFDPHGDPPDLMPQVDGVDSSAEGKSDDPKDQDDQENNTEAMEEELNLVSANENSNEISSSSSSASSVTQAAENSSSANNSTTTFQNNSKCDKLKILSEMENKFAKETQNALKNRPVYKKRQNMAQSESWDLKNGKTTGEDQSKNHQDIIIPSLTSNAKKIILMKEPGELEVTANPDENTPMMTNSSEMAASSSSSSSALRDFRFSRKFRKGSRNSTSSSLVSPNSACNADDNDMMEFMDQDTDQGPPNITGGAHHYHHHPSTSPPKIRMQTMSPPPHLTPEVGPNSAVPSPLRIDIPDHYQSTPPLSSFSGSGYQRRLLIKTPPAARAGLVTMVSEAVLSKEDAEMAATAVQLGGSPRNTLQHTEPFQIISGLQNTTNPMNNCKPSSSSSSNNEAIEHPSLKIRLPKVNTTTNLVITGQTGNATNTNSNSVATSSGAAIGNTITTPHVKKAAKKRQLHEQSDGGIDTEEDEHEFHKRKKHIDHEKMSAGEDTDGGGKTTPDSQITNDDKIMVPEKASSFNIHPERTCSDCCFYCRQKFGLFDTPLHISQMKSLELQKLAIEFSNCSKDACLCDKCYRLVDRSARNKKKESDGEATNMTTEKVRSCFVRNCNKEVVTSVSKKWLHRLKKRLIKKLNTDWDKIAKASMKSTFPVCSKHNNIIDYFSHCGLCKTKLSLKGICCLKMNKAEVQNLNELLRADSIPSGLAENMFVCKLCKLFCGIKQKAANEPDYLKHHKNHKFFIKEQKKRLYTCLGLDNSLHDDLLNSPDSTNGSPKAKTQKIIHQVSQSDNPTKITIKTFEVPSNHHQERDRRKRRQKEFQSPNSDSRILVTSVNDHSKSNNSSSKNSSSSEGSSHHSNSSSVHGHSASSSSRNDNHKPNVEVHDNSGAASSADNRLPMCSITISFDQNTQKLWDDLHLPYETYTSFFRHLILLEKYFRNGDLVLSDSASTKASSYIRSLQNRIEEFEVKHKRSHAELSASTRPDLSVPPEPGLDCRLPAVAIDPPTTRQKSSDREVSQSPKTNSHGRGGGSSHQKSSDNHHPADSLSSTILKIPKVSMPNNVPTVIDPPNSPPMPLRIRVRDDLKYLGLEPNRPPKQVPTSSKQQNIMTSSTSAGHQQNSTNKAIISSGNSNATTSNIGSRPNTSTNLMQLLNDPTLKQKQKGPTLGHTSLVGGLSNTSKAMSSSSGSSSKSSNSQLFKSSGDTSSSSAIPLTFNNSIAEVLAAAAKSKSRNAAAASGGAHGSNEATSKAEVTITPKSSVNQQQPKSSAVISAGPSNMMGQQQQLQSLLYANSSLSTKPQTTLSSVAVPSIIASGNPSNKEQQLPSVVSGKQSKSAMKTNPLLDMSKLLHNQPIGIAPHMVAQNTLAIPTTGTAAVNASISAVVNTPKPVLSTHQMAGTMPKIAPKPTSSILKPVPVAVSKPSGIQTVNKKSLNTVLDRLSGLKSSTGGSSSSSGSNSSLVQQLQAPPMMTNPGLTSPTKQSRNSTAAVSTAAASATSTLSSMQQQQSSNAAAAANNAAMQQALLASQLGMGFPGASGAAASSLVGQPMVQFPWATSSAATVSPHGSAAQQAALADAQRALTMAGAGLPGMNQAAALAALQELMKINLQAQVKTSGQRLRAPPPLTHMGRPGGSNNPNNNPKPKNPE